MCNFWSAIVTEKGKVLWKLGVDSHSQLEEIFKLKDDSAEPTYAKVELVPDNIVTDKLKDWKFTLDEERQPSWWNKGYEGLVRLELKKNVIKHYRIAKAGRVTLRGWHENGQLRYELQHKQGKKDGVLREWYNNGQLRYELQHKQGKKDGVCRGWYENGQLRYELQYKQWKKDGVCRGWYENGQLMYEDNYKQGERIS